MNQGLRKWHDFEGEKRRRGRASPCRIYLSPPPKAVIKVKVIVVWGGVGWGGMGAS